MNRPWAYLLVPCAVAGAVAACNGSGAIAEPISNKQADDPCDPGQSATSTGSAPPVDAGALPVVLPGGSGGIGFDDLRFAADLSQLLVPAAGTGNLDLVDPSSEQILSIGGFASQPDAGAAVVGVTSADEGNGTLYAVDRTKLTLTVIDATTKSVQSTATLAAAPGYVRFVAPTNEVWVSEPGAGKIEIFSLPGVGQAPKSSGTVSAPGAESLEIDAVHKLAFTNGATTTYSITTDATRKVGSGWANGCQSAKGIAVDAAHGWVLVGCAEGGLTVLSSSTGQMLGRVSTGGGIDRIAYDPVRLRAYVPTPDKSSMVVVGLGPNTGAASVLGSVQAPAGAHCVVTPGGADMFVCDPAHGQLVLVNDPF